MSQTYASLNFHCIWSTKGRLPQITPEIEDSLHRYIGGIVRQGRGRLLAIGGTSDHVHLFITVPQTVFIPKLMQEIKAKSSKFVHENFADYRSFAWQSGYGIFSVSISMSNTVKNYVLNQKEHHKTSSFEKEYFGFLRRHDIVFDPKDVLG